MAIREGEDRRVGGDSEKLLTLEEAAHRLKIPADDVEVLIRERKLTAFRIGGTFLRIRLKDVEAIEGSLEVPSRAGPEPGIKVGTEEKLLRLEPSAKELRSASLWDRFFDFITFNDFYLVAILVILTLLAIIFAL